MDTTPQTPVNYAPDTLISVIIPVYNRADYIEEAMASVIAESLVTPNLELVMVDDGSTDNTLAVMESWIAQYQASTSSPIPIILRSRSNRGFVPTLNELITLARGNTIVFFGSDDVLVPGGIAARWAYLQANPEKLMVLGDAALIDGQGQITHASAYAGVGMANMTELRRADAQSDDVFRRHLVLNGYVPGATLMARKAVYERFGLYDENFHAEDWVYYARIAAHNPDKCVVGFLDHVVAQYRMHDNNMSMTPLQLTHSCEQLSLLPGMLVSYPWRFKGVVLKRLLFQCLYVPYLWLKFSQKPKAGKNTAKTVTPVASSVQVPGRLERLKTAFNRVLGPCFGRYLPDAQGGLGQAELQTPLRSQPLVSPSEFPTRAMQGLL